MVHGFNHTASEASKDEWLTPPAIVEALGVFDLDPCSPHPDKRPWATAKEHYYLPMDGLGLPWRGRVWCNPPYGSKTFEWLERLASHGDGIALIFARTETKGFHEQIWAKADAVFFFKGRLAFHHVTGQRGASANAPSCLIAYGANNVEAIERAVSKGALAGCLVRINTVFH